MEIDWTLRVGPFRLNLFVEYASLSFWRERKPSGPLPPVPQIWNIGQWELAFKAMPDTSPTITFHINYWDSGDVPISTDTYTAKAVKDEGE